MATHAPSPVSAPDRAGDAETVGQMILDAAGRHSGVALRVRDGEGWREITFPELGEGARATARGLIALGIRPGDRVAILAQTSPEWTLADCGALLAGAVVVPVYATNAPEECAYVLAHSGARAVLCDDAGQVAKVRQVREQCPELEHVIALEAVDGEMSLAELQARGAEVDGGLVDDIVTSVTPEDRATIVYTSGTTGPPKGCVMTHRNCVSTLRMYQAQVDLGPDPLVFFMFLPLAHSLARIVQWFALDVGAVLSFWRGDPTVLIDDIADAAPTHLPSVPRVFEKVHTRALAGVEEGSPPKRRLFQWALVRGQRAAATGDRGGLPFRVADRLVLSRVRGLFGPNLRLALTGAAPIARTVLEFFEACGVTVLEGYGMTETCAAATLNTPDALRFGTVGPPLPGMEIRIADDGEVLMRGPNVTPGYHRDDAATAELFEGGWLRSGDLGSLDEDGFLSITGRKKDLIITSSGKNITPANLESALRESRWISQAVLYGDNHPYLVAAVTLDPEEAAALAEHAGAPRDLAAMRDHPGVRDAIAEEIERVNGRFARIEQVKRFAILDHDLSLAEGELTPTLKIKRNVVYERYHDVFEGLYL